MYKGILIPTDGSELAEKAVQHGIALAKAIGAKITFLTVSETQPQYKTRPDEPGAKILRAAADAASAAGVACDTVNVEHQDPYRAIIDTANSKRCDLIVMASHGRRGVAAVVLGSVTVKVLTHAKVPVLVCR